MEVTVLRAQILTEILQINVKCTNVIGAIKEQYLL